MFNIGENKEEKIARQPTLPHRRNSKTELSILAEREAYNLHEMFPTKE
jgi:hypothetical protein